MKGAKSLGKLPKSRRLRLEICRDLHKQTIQVQCLAPWTSWYMPRDRCALASDSARSCNQSDNWLQRCFHRSIQRSEGFQLNHPVFPGHAAVEQEGVQQHSDLGHGCRRRTPDTCHISSLRVLEALTWFRYIPHEANYDMKKSIKIFLTNFHNIHDRVVNHRQAARHDQGQGEGQE